MNYASNELERLIDLSVNIPSEMSELYQSLSIGLCQVCKEELVVVQHSEDEAGFSYKYRCGHGFQGIMLRDEIGTIRDGVRVQVKRKGVELARIFSGYKPSRDPKLSEGVTIEMTVDYENDEYHQKVTNNLSNKVTHEEHGSLKEHARKQKEKYIKSKDQSRES